ncbi:hypothetical protein SDC9_198752 [bioreactor metagenome]|uniref:Uncharacterized protein n=1 Tax=bioreactor metagenome TaxID=1076179 RepID=A0A645IJ05_9ZZZZ
MEGEALVAGSGLAFGAGERVFVLGARVEKNREVLSDRTEPGGDHLLRRGADHHPVAVARTDRQAGAGEQGVAHPAADGVDLHA